MKKDNFVKTLLLTAAMGLGGCSDNLTNDAGSQGQVLGEGEGYVTFKISNIGEETRATRADATDVDDAFNAGEEYEYAITSVKGSNVVFLFDGGSNKFVDMKDLQIASQPSNNSSAEDDHENKDGEKYLSAYIKKADLENPLKCVVILNANPDLLSQLKAKVSTNTTLEDFVEQKEILVDNPDKDGKLGRYETSATTYFTMSNTVYLDSNDDVVNYATITKDNVCDTPDEAMQKPVTIHVERIVAKFSLGFGDGITFTDGDIIAMSNKLKLRTSATTAATEVSWKVKVEGWAMNGTETETFWIKNLDMKNANGVKTQVYDKANNYVIGNWNYTYTTSDKGWNDITRLRCYWAVDPHYDRNNQVGDVYPQQYREAKDETGVVDYGDGCVLNYIPFVDISTGRNGHLYAPENTFGDLAFLQSNDGDVTKYAYKGTDYKRAATHVLIAARLMFDGETASNIDDKYCYEGIYWKGENKADLMKYMAEQFRFAYGPTLYTAANEESVFLPLETTNIEDYFTLEAPATIKGGDGRVMLRLTGTLYKRVLKAGSETDYEFVTVSADDPELQTVIYAVGTAEHFKEGNMYYAIPIVHMANKSETSTETLYNIGSYGVVRNHWYKVNIKSISKPGIPVDDPDQPIIPNDEPDEGGYISFQIVIIPWHVINWGVDL